MEAERRPLLSAGRKDSRVKRIGVVVVLLVGTASLVGRAAPGRSWTSLFFQQEAPADYVLRSEELSSEEVWRSPNWEGARSVVELEEHVLSEDSKALWAYTNWRSFAQGPIGLAADALDEEVAVEVRSTWYSAAGHDAFMEKVAKRELKPGSIVFTSITPFLDTAADAAHLVEERGVDRDVLLHGCNDGCDSKELGDLEMDQSCVYGHSAPGKLLTYMAEFRDLLAYPDPLVLILAGDSACKLVDLPPESHHRFVLANDASQTQVDALRARGVDAWAWPMGMEGMLLESADADAASYEAHAGPMNDFLGAVQRSRLDDNNSDNISEQKRLLVYYSGSAFFRKPSRVALGNFMALDGGTRQIARLAEAAGLDAYVTSYGIHGQGYKNGEPQAAAVEWTLDTSMLENTSLYAARNWTENESRSYFTLAPAGDDWTTGRVYEAILLNSVPVVDATFETDGGDSSKGCDGDASLFWRRVDEKAGGETFVFVENWHKLPETLREAGALDPAKRAKRVAALRRTARVLAETIRDPVMTFSLQDNGSRLQDCRSLPNSHRAADLDRKAAYYSRQGDGPAPWFDAYNEPPSDISNKCSKKQIPNLRSDLVCFDPDCLVPSADAFVCHAY